MSVLSPQVEHTLTRPWATATAVAVLFVAIEDLAAAIGLLIFFVSPGVDFGDGSLRWEIVRDEWSIHLTFLLIALAAAYVLRLAARSDIHQAWQQLVLRAVIVYVPVSIALNFVVGLVFALIHHDPFRLFGIEILG
jgi:hypothetical protein